MPLYKYVKTMPTGAIVGTTDTQTLTNKTLTTPTITQTAWTAVTFANSWVDFGGTAQTCAYMKDSMGFVHLKGLMKSGTLGATAFNLPAGYRPAAYARFATMANGAFGSADLPVGGDFSVSAASNAFVTLDGITFRAEN